MHLRKEFGFFFALCRHMVTESKLKFFLKDLMDGKKFFLQSALPLLNHELNLSEFLHFKCCMWSFSSLFFSALTFNNLKLCNCRNVQELILVVAQFHFCSKMLMSISLTNISEGTKYLSFASLTDDELHCGWWCGGGCWVFGDPQIFRNVQRDLCLMQFRFSLILLTALNSRW